MALVVAVGTACGVGTEDALPPGVRDPATIQTAAGAVGFYRGVLTIALSSALDRYVFVSALLTDEATASATEAGLIGGFFTTNSRLMPEGSPYLGLHRLRAQAREARGFLTAYAADSSPALQGHMYAVEGYADVFLADYFCSGIPLSTVDFQGDYTLVAGSTTQEVYRRAVALFDRALTLTADSVRLWRFAAVGRARALLALGDYAAAASSVTDVPDDFTMPASPPSNTATRFMRTAIVDVSQSPGVTTMADGEGLNGLNFRTSNDPRARVTSVGTNFFSGQPMYVPSKYAPVNSAWTFKIASGVEARLLEAEAALQAGDPDTWLAKLNQLRQSPAVCGAIVPATTCPLALLEDPGTSLSDPAAAKAARVDLLFRERAFWLYATGHRQGDLRRLVREYQRLQQTVYPTGFYQGGTGAYGGNVVAKVPEEERTLNTKYSGCFHLEA